MTTQHPNASRTRLPILIAAWLFIIAATITMSSGLTGTVQAETEQGTIPSLTLDSTEPGQLIITWETPDPAPTDYRLRWAPATRDFLSYKDDNEAERGNLYPPGDVTTLTLNNLTPGDSYKVQMRSRYYNADRSVRESSGPWTEYPHPESEGPPTGSAHRPHCGTNWPQRPNPHLGRPPGHRHNRVPRHERNRRRQPVIPGK